ncbi:MAG: ribonuclease III [Anaerolineae bacterium]|nr:ribonuclease III [Anaerolineae bacterium]MCO5203928.1 ribonuclease III [Anaerolineae bacterium]
MNDLKQLEYSLGVRFNNTELLERALTHRSYLNEHAEISADNERLEFLGDAVLDFLVGAYLFNRFPDKQEGELTTLRAALVKTQTLAGFARQLQIDAHLRLGYGEEESGGRRKNPTLCAAFEAVIGAVYLDQGLETVRGVVTPLLEPALTTILADSLHIDAKSEFQVWAQATYNITPHYNVIAAEGPDHARKFTVQVLVGDTVWGTGSGTSKQKAAQAAAAHALSSLPDA